MAGKLRALGVDGRRFHRGGRGERGGGVGWRGWREQRDDSARRLIVGMGGGGWVKMKKAWGSWHRGWQVRKRFLRGGVSSSRERWEIGRDFGHLFGVGAKNQARDRVMGPPWWLGRPMGEDWLAGLRGGGLRVPGFE
jgi:hypothetical protein